MEDAVYRAMMDSPIMGFAHHRIILGDEGKPVDYEFLGVNTTFEKLTGLSREKILGHRVREAIPGIEAEEFDWIAFYGAVALGGGEKNFEQFSQPLGRWYRVHVYSTEKYYFSTVFIDITESKKQTAELEGFFSVNLDLLCIADLEGHFIKTNEAWKDILGYSTDELSSRKFLEFVHPEDISPTMEALSTLGQGGEVLNFTNRYRCRDGSYRYIEWRSHPMGNLIYAAARDVTQRMEAEAALQAREENFRLFFDTMQDMVVVGTPAGHVLYANQALLDTLGYSLAELDQLGLLGVHPPERQAEAQEIFTEMLRGERDYCPLPVRAKDGHVVPVETRISLGQWFGEDCIFGVIKDISEEQAALQKFDKLFDVNPAPMALSRLPERQFVEVNQAFLQLTGYCREEVLGKSSVELGLFADPDYLRQTGELLRKDGFIRNLELQVKGKNGVLRDGLFSAEIIEVQGVSYVLTVMVDVTERKKAAEATKEASVRLELATKAGGVGVWDYDIVNNCLEWDDQMYTLYGIGRETFGGAYESWRAGLHPDDLAREDREVEMALRGEREFDTEFRVMWPDGSVRYIRALATVLRDADGAARRMIGTNWDITERKEAEVELAEMSFLQGFLIEIATTFIDVPLQAAHNSIEYALGELGRFIGADRAYIFAYDWDAQVTRNTFEWCDEGIAPQIEKLQRVPLPENHDWVEIHRRGQIVVVEDVLDLAPQTALRQMMEEQDIQSLISLPMMDGDQCLGFIGFDSVREKKTYSDDAQKLLFVFALMLVSLEKRNRTQEELATALRAAEAASVAKGQFLANMSHEIRTPLNGVVGFLELLQLSRLDPEQAEYVRDAKGAASQLLSLINDILDFSKIEAGKLELEQVEFNLRAVVDDIVVLLRSRAADKGLALQAVISAKVPEIIQGDPSRLKQILSNLVGNAVKFTLAGEVTVTVDCPEPAEEGETAEILLAVKDTGIGIDAEALAGLFRPFTQADASTTRKFGGTGLGLAISKELVNLMGGDIEATSQIGEGSTFSLRLPMPVIKATQELPPTLAALAGSNVLLVDDNPTNRRVVRGYLQEAGVNAYEAGDGGSAIAEIVTRAGTEQAFAAAIVDQQMPGMSGLELAKALSHIPSAQSVKLILYTSAALRGSAQEARAEGFAGYLTKPARRDEVLGCLAIVLGFAKADAAAPLVTRYSVREAEFATELRILLAEDNDINAKIVIRLLATQKLHCDVVTDGEQAYQAATTKDYDLILMDCQMPEVDGYASTRRIREWEGEGRQRHTPIIALTAHAMEGDRDKCLASGMDDYLSKPLNPDELFAAIARHSGSLAAREESKAGVQADESGADIAAIDIAQRQRAFASAIGLPMTEAAEIFADFAAFLPGVMREIEEALAGSEMAAAAALAHKLKGAAGTMRLQEIAEPASRLEDYCLAQAKTPESFAGPEVQAIFNEIRQAVTIFD